MTRYAITADVHGRTRRLCSVIADARAQGATQFMDLGDVGNDSCYDLLRQVGARACFGNYEVSRWGYLSPENQVWVRRLEPLLVGQTFLAAHAAPYLPAGLWTVDDVLDYILEEKVRWRALFPRLDQDDQARWLTYAQLVERDKRLLFHGHTHLQGAWRIEPGGAMRAVANSHIVLDQASVYLIGVGSVGEPEDGPTSRYALYDTTERVVELRTVCS